ncbi:MAG TPA: hypothetical protein VKG43_02420 [Acidimicrobiales bacterium]|nr:hypothetical protein [Acidimicrobiales bacterium]
MAIPHDDGRLLEAADQIIESARPAEWRRVRQRRFGSSAGRLAVLLVFVTGCSLLFTGGISVPMLAFYGILGALTVFYQEPSGVTAERRNRTRALPVDIDPVDDAR